MPTAFVIQTLCGGVFGVENFLMQDNENKHKKRVPHFFNIVDGKYVDFTREQMKYRENIRNVKVLNV